MKKKLISIFLTILFTFSSVLPTLASTSVTTTSPIINRISGQNRYDTASQIAKRGWPNGSSNCILTFGGNYSDSLVATPLAKKYDAPILLTESASLTPITRQTLIDLKAKSVTIIGGTGVISASVDIELQSMGITTKRIFGNDTYETAVAVAKQVTLTPSIIFVCNSDDFTDALSISPIASIQQDPIILVSHNSIPGSVKNYIASNNIVKSYVIGNSDEVMDNVANQFPNSERISGNDSYSRNIAVNKKFNTVFKPNNITVASGEQFPDALSGSALASKIVAPIILVNNTLSNDTKSYYQQRVGKDSSSQSSNINPSVYVFGGTAVVPDSVIQDLDQGKVITVSHLSAVNVTTTTGIAPELPATVTATMSDGTTKTVHVNWETMALSQRTRVESFIVIGTIAESTTVKATATVTVADVNPVVILTTQEVQKDILGTWMTSDGSHTLKFYNDGTLEATEILSGYSTIDKEKYSISNPTRLRIVNSSWTTSYNILVKEKQLTIYNMGIPHIAGNSGNFSNDISHPVDFSQSSNPINYVFTKVD